MRLFFLALAGCTILSAQTSIQVVYTGKLLGYPRMPELQRLRKGNASMVVGREGAAFAQTACAESAGPTCIQLYESVAGTVGNGFAQSFETQLRSSQVKGAARVLVGTGDNFGVELLSRITLVEGKGYVPKDELSWLSPKGANGKVFALHLADLTPQSLPAFIEDQISGQSVIDADNVAAFFTGMGYDALVPGKHDFYFGPERLRQIGRLLAKGETALLGVNLLIRSTYARAPVAKADARRRDFLLAAGDARWDVPLTPLPWMRAVRLRGGWDKEGQALFTGRAALHVYGGGGDRDRLPAELVKGCESLEVERTGQTRDGVVRFGAKAGECFHQRPVPAERTYAVCVELTKAVDGKKQLCQPFDVVSPFLQYPDIADQAYRGGQVREGSSARVKPGDAAAGAQIPLWKQRKDGIILFGAVAPGMEVSVGMLNLRWWNTDPNVETQVTTSDPAEALSQALDYCEELKVCGADSTLLLLAQMPRDAAQILNSRLNNRFKLVVAQADRMLATERATVTYEPGHRPVVVVPDELVEKGVLQFGLQQALLTKGPAEAGYRVVTSGLDRNSLKLAPLEDPATPCLQPELRTHAAELVKANKGPAEQFRWLTLDRMRRYANADIAMLQERDFFDVEKTVAGCRTKPDGGHEKVATIEHILWKGDFVVARPITGASLLAAVRESERLRKLNDDRYANEAEHGRWLQMLGVQRDGSTWYVNGKPVEATASYTVAMSDYLAFGDTGYGDLKDGSIAPPPRMRQMRSTPRIAELVAQEFGAKDRHIEPESYYDHSDHKPFLQAPRASWFDQFAAQFRVTLKPKPDQRDVVNRLGQSRTYRRFFLDKAEVGGSRYRHNLGPNPASNFGDSPEAALSSQNKFNIAFSLQAELRKEMYRHQLFLRHEVDLTRESVQGAESYTLNFPQNRMTFEGGWRRAFSNFRQTPRWGMLLSANMQMQPQTPQKYYRLSLVCASNCDAGGLPASVNFRSDIGRNTRYNGKAGIRGEGGASWFEAGMFLGASIRPVAFTPQFEGQTLATKSGGAASPCTLSSFSRRNPKGYTTLARCLDGEFRFALPYEDARRLANTPDALAELQYQRGTVADSGVFVNFNWRLKLPVAFGFSELAIENRGQYFFNHAGKTFVDPLFSESLRVGPTLPLTRSLNLKPTYTVFFYRNRVDNTLLRSGSVDLKIEYRFDRGSGLSWRDALRYGRPR